MQPDDDDAVELVDAAVIGPSRPHRQAHKRRRQTTPKRKAPYVPPQDIIEISSSDDDYAAPVPREETMERRVEDWVHAQARAGPSKRSPSKAPLFLADGDHGMWSRVHE